MTEPRHINTADIDWNRPDAAICRQTGLNYVVVRDLRRYVFNTTFAPTAHWQARYGHIPWDKVDWENNSNATIGKEFGIDANVVRQVRIVHGYPINAHHKRCGSIVTDEMLATVDWEWTQDMEIANRFRVSRERIRQLRLMNQKPPSKVEHMSKIQLHRLRWAKENADKIKGKPVAEVIQSYPHRRHMGAERERWRQISDLLGLEIDFTSRVPDNTGKYAHMNFDLSNRVLAFIWGCCQPVIANFRHQNHKQYPRWKRGGFTTQWKTPEFYNAVWMELDKAIKSGREIDFNIACQILQVPTPEQQKSIDVVSKT